MQQEISQLESDLGVPNTTSATTTTAGATSSAVSSTCSNNQQTFSNLVTQFNQTLQSGQTASVYSILLVLLIRLFIPVPKRKFSLESE